MSGNHVLVHPCVEENHVAANVVEGTKRPTRFLLMATAPQAVVLFLTRQIFFLVSNGFEVHTIASPGIECVPGHTPLPSTHHSLPMERTIHPIADFVALLKLCRLMRRIKPDIVQTHTPKAGLLGMIAATMARVPVRIYTINGLPLFTQKGIGWLLVAAADWLACSLATEVICPSRCLRRFIVNNGFCRREKARTLGDGGFPGVDPDKYRPGKKALDDRVNLRQRNNIPVDALVFGFVGRIVPDKGVAELVRAWAKLREEFPQSYLLLCGHFEAVHPLPPELVEQLKSDSRVRLIGWTTDMPPVYAAIDICILPTYREAISGVVLEAAAMEVPVVTTRVPGSVDAICKGRTGLSVPAKDSEALADAVRRLAVNPQLCRAMGTAARKFVAERFSHQRIFQNLLNEYHRLLSDHVTR
jgi:glycosyltransferase involved in cell wall biosynthesis